MALQRRLRTILGLAGLSLLAAGCGGGEGQRSAEKPGAGSKLTAPAGEKTLLALGKRLQEGDRQALVDLFEKVKLPEGTPATAPTASEAADWVDVAGHLRAAYGRAGAQGKATILQVLGRVMERFGADGTPAGWSKLLPAVHDSLLAGLVDAEPLVRKLALDEVGKLWGWGPGCTMTPAEEQSVATCKERLHTQTLERMKDPEPVVRMAAVACLGLLPLDDAAAPAMAGLQDKEFSVRFQTLSSFAGRPALLTEESLLPLLHDPVADLHGLAERVLAARGLTPDLIGLGRMISDPNPEMRATAISLLEGRQDVDPVVWLLRLTEDRDAGVRLKAVRAFEGRITPEVTQRLREMVAADESPEVRAAAEKLVPPSKTAFLPPPGAASLRARAN